MYNKTIYEQARSFGLSITYLDNSATTVVCDAAAEKAVYMMTQCFGNPSSLHRLALRRKGS